MAEIETRKVCRLCFKLAGNGEGLRQMPNGNWAHGDCISARFCETVIRLACKKMPDIPRIGIDRHTEAVINRFLKAIGDKPMAIVADVVKLTDEFSKKFMGKSISTNGQV